MRKLIFLLMCAASIAVPTAFCAAQQAQAVPRARVPALVAISPELLHAETPFRLARFGGNSPRDVILLAPNADEAALTQAVEALLAVRRQSGDVPTSDATLRVRQPHRMRVLPWAARVLRDVHAARSREIAGVGRLQAVQIWLPAQR